MATMNPSKGVISSISVQILIDTCATWCWSGHYSELVCYESSFCVPIAQVVEHPLREWEVLGSIPGCAIPKALKMVPVATLLGAQHYKASTGFSPPTKYRTTNTASFTINHSPKTSDNNNCLYSSEDHMEDWQSCYILYPPKI